MIDPTQLVVAGIAAAALILGAIVGASLQYFYSRSAEAKRHERGLRLNAYSDYLRSVGEAETLQSMTDSARRSEIMARAIAAKARVCVNGSAAAVQALSRLEREPGRGLTAEKRSALLEFIAAVRKDMGAPGKVSQAEIEAILFRSDTV